MTDSGVDVADHVSGGTGTVGGRGLVNTPHGCQREGDRSSADAVRPGRGAPRRCAPRACLDDQFQGLARDADGPSELLT